MGKEKSVGVVDYTMYALDRSEHQLPNLEMMLTTDYDGPDWLSNFAPNDDKTISLAMLSQQKGTIDVESKEAQKFPVQYWCVERHFRFKDEEGKTRPGVTLTLINPKGEAIVVTSDVVIRFWQFAVRLRGVGPFDPALEVCFEKLAASKGRKMIQLRVLS